MSDKLIKQVAVELEQLSNLLQTYLPSYRDVQQSSLTPSNFQL